MDVVVVGRIARDLALPVDEVPAAGSTAAVLQLQQPLDSVRRAAELARGTVVLAGAPPSPDARAELLAAADVLRADDAEAAL